MEQVCVAPLRGDDDRQCFERYYTTSGQRAFHLAFRMLGNRAEAEDVVQDAFVRAWRHFSRYDRRRPFDTWLSAIVVNLCIDRRRRAGRLPICSLDAPIAVDDAGAPVCYDPPDQGVDPADLCADQVLDETLQHALHDLDPIYRAAVLLSSAGDLSYAEMAQILGCPVGTVRSRIHRGRVLLRRALRPCSGAPASVRLRD